MIQLTLISRAYCHLCHEMEHELRNLVQGVDCSGGQICQIKVVDVDADPVLEARYDADVPVLLHGTRELCRHRLDIAKVRDYLREIG